MKHQAELERGLLIDMNESDRSAASVLWEDIDDQALAIRSDSFQATRVVNEVNARASSCNLFY